MTPKFPTLDPTFSPPPDWPRYCGTCGRTSEPAILRYDPYTSKPEHGMLCVQHPIPYIWDPKIDKPDDDDNRFFLRPIP